MENSLERGLVTDEKIEAELLTEAKKCFANASQRDLLMYLESCKKFLAMIHEGQNDYSFEQYKKDMIRSFEFDGHLLNELRRTEAF